QDFAGTGRNQDVFGLDAVVFGNRLTDTAIRITIPVSVLPHIIHCFEDSFGWAVRILIVGQFRHLVVRGLRILSCPTRCSRRGAITTTTLSSLLCKKFERIQTDDAQSGRDSAHKASSSNVTLLWHFPSVL